MEDGSFDSDGDGGEAHAAEETEEADDSCPSETLTSPSSETDALKAQMLQMQQQLLQMQKMLAEKEKQDAIQEAVETKKKVKKIFQENLPSHASKQVSSKDKTTPTSGKKPVKSPSLSSQKSPKPQLKLVPDDGDNLFFQSASQSSSSSSKTPKSDRSSAKSKKEDSAKVQSHSSKVKEKVPETKKVTSRELFGDSDSDWEDLDGEDKRTLSDAGKDLKRLINSGQKKREAHQPNYKLNESAYPKSQSWSTNSNRELAPSEPLVKSRSKEIKPEKNRIELPKRSPPVQKIDKNMIGCKVSASQQKDSLIKKEEKAPDPYVTEDYSRIRIVNPLVSSYMMKSRMEGRKMINLSKIHHKVKTPDLDGDWVTIAVLVGKSESKSSKTGKAFSIWKLNDLDDLDNSVSFFLFGEVWKTHWKMDIGTVLGVLNPDMMDSMDKKNSEPAFTIKNPNQLMIMGRSKDLGWCHGTTKKGNKCSQFTNTKFGDFCAYHVQAEYRKTSSKRLELHGSIAGIKPKSFEKKIFSKDTAYMYGGQTFVPNAAANNAKKKKKELTLAKLQSTMQKGQVNTLSIHNVKTKAPSSGIGGKFDPMANSRLGDISENSFAEMVSVPTPGSMNFVAYLKNKEEKDAGKKSGDQTSSSNMIIQSVKASDMIKQHKEEMRRKERERKLEQARKKDRIDPLAVKPQLGKGFNTSQEIALDLRGQQSPKTSITLEDLKKVCSALLHCIMINFTQCMPY